MHDVESVTECHENADRIEGPEGLLICMCRPGYTGDGVTSCDGQ